MKTICLALGIIMCLLLSGTAAKDFTFPEISGWKQSEEIQTFIPKTLYEYINGAADLYLAYDFEELKVAEYQNEKKASVTTEVYRHKNPTYAFGIYSQERHPNANFIDIGAQGYIEEEVLNFLAGSYYVKISCYKIESRTQEVLLSFARKVTENLGEGGTLPSILASFPEECRVKHSEKFTAKNFLGYSFLHSAFTADYELAGKKFKLFVIEMGDQNECRNMVQKYLEQTGKPEKTVAEGEYTISDPHHGEIGLRWQGRHIWGIVNIDDLHLRTKYLKLFEEGLTKSKKK